MKIPMWDVIANNIQKLAENNISLKIWWRDDDIRFYRKDFEKITHIFSENAIPLVLSVIPHRLENKTVEHIRGFKNVIVVQHGFDHINYGREEKIELSKFHNKKTLVKNILKGRNRLEKMFREQFYPIMVPPWNRIDLDIEDLLHDLGFVGISTFSRVMPSRKNNIYHINPLIDFIDWNNNDSFAGEVFFLKQFLREIEYGVYSYPIGILSHHRTIGEGGFLFLEKLIFFLRQFENIEWWNIRNRVIA